jgi:glycine C-acetyltransferase
MHYEDILAKCDSDEGYFGKFRAQGDRYFTMPVMESKPGSRMRFEGRDCIMWSLNNYLGLAENDEVKRVAARAVEEWGVSGPMGSRMMSGNTVDHIELEKELAGFAQKESSIVFNYGYLGVIGTISSLVQKGDIIVMDKLCHAAIVDAALSAVQDRKNIHIFHHNDMDSLEGTLRRANEVRKRGVLLLAEGVYGMTGDAAKLEAICELKDRYEARLFIDDAHGFGVMGRGGRGMGECTGVQDKIDIYLGTFAKAFAAIGGFSASRGDVVEWIRYNARTQIFAKSLPMVYVKSLRKTLELVRNGDARRARMFHVSRKLADGLRQLGFYVRKVESPIVPVFVPGGDLSVALEWIRYLRHKGVFVSGVAYPVIPKRHIMFRMVPTASHNDTDIETTVEAFKNLRDDNKLHLDINWSVVDKLYGATQ